MDRKLKYSQRVTQNFAETDKSIIEKVTGAGMVEDAAQDFSVTQVFWTSPSSTNVTRPPQLSVKKVNIMLQCALLTQDGFGQDTTPLTNGIEIIYGEFGNSLINNEPILPIIKSNNDLFSLCSNYINSGTFHKFEFELTNCFPISHLYDNNTVEFRLNDNFTIHVGALFFTIELIQQELD